MFSSTGSVALNHGQNYLGSLHNGLNGFQGRTFGPSPINKLYAKEYMGSSVKFTYFINDNMFSKLHNLKANKAFLSFLFYNSSLFKFTGFMAPWKSFHDFILSVHYRQHSYHCNGGSPFGFHRISF